MGENVEAADIVAESLVVQGRLPDFGLELFCFVRHFLDLKGLVVVFSCGFVEEVVP